MKILTLRHVRQHGMGCVSQDHDLATDPPRQRSPADQWPFDSLFNQPDDLLQSGSKVSANRKTSDSTWMHTANPTPGIHVSYQPEQLPDPKSTGHYDPDVREPY